MARCKSTAPQAQQTAQDAEMEDQLCESYGQIVQRRRILQQTGAMGGCPARVNHTRTNGGLTPAGERTYSGVFEAALYEVVVNSKCFRYSKLRAAMVPFCSCPAS